MDKIKNIYADEMDKLDSEFENQLTVWLKINDVLEYHGYALTPRLEAGLPSVELTKLS